MPDVWFQTGRFTDASLDPSGKYLVTANADCSLAIWDVATQTEKLKRQHHLCQINSVAWSSDGRYIVSASDDKLIIITDSEDLKILRILRGHTASVTSAVFSPKGNVVASASIDETVKIWDIKGERSLMTLNAHSDPVVSVDISYDNRYIMSGSHDGTFRIWEIRTGHCLHSVMGAGLSKPLLYARFSPNSRFVAVGVKNGETRLVDWAEEAPKKRYLHPQENQVGRGIGFYKEYIYIGSKEGVDVFDIQSMELKETLFVDGGVTAVSVQCSMGLIAGVGPKNFAIWHCD